MPSFEHFNEKKIVILRKKMDNRIKRIVVYNMKKTYFGVYSFKSCFYCICYLKLS